MKPFGYGYVPKSVTREEIKENLRRWAWFGEAHVDNLWSETLKYIEELEQNVNQDNVQLLEALRVASEQIEMMKAQLIIRRDRITNLRLAIMDMKQTIADKETEIERLKQYESMVRFITNDYIELSYEKAQLQRDDWYKRCNKTITGI